MKGTVFIFIRNSVDYFAKLVRNNLATSRETGKVGNLVGESANPSATFAKCVDYFAKLVRNNLATSRNESVCWCRD